MTYIKRQLIASIAFLAFGIFVLFLSQGNVMLLFVGSASLLWALFFEMPIWFLVDAIWELNLNTNYQLMNAVWYTRKSTLKGDEVNISFMKYKIEIGISYGGFNKPNFKWAFLIFKKMNTPFRNPFVEPTIQLLDNVDEEGIPSASVLHSIRKVMYEQGLNSFAIAVCIHALKSLISRAVVADWNERQS